MLKNAVAERGGLGALKDRCLKRFSNATCDK